MTTAIIGTGAIGTAIAGQLARGGEALKLSSANKDSARTLAEAIGEAAVIGVDNRSALLAAGAVILALRFSVLKNVIDEIDDALGDKSLVVPGNPVGLDPHGEIDWLLPGGQSSGETMAGWLTAGARLAMAFDTMSADLFESSSNRSPEPAVLFYATDDNYGGNEVERLIRTSGFEPMKVGGITEPTRGGRGPSRSRSRPRWRPVPDRWGLTHCRLGRRRLFGRAAALKILYDGDSRRFGHHRRHSCNSRSVPDPIRSEAVRSRLPEPRLNLIYRLEATVGEPQDVGDIPTGHRRIIPLTGGTFSGPELNGTLIPAASADWQIILSDGTALGDVRYTLKTERGDLLYVQSQSVRHGPPEVLARLGRGEEVDASEYTFRASAIVETGAEGLEWLNKGIFISVGGRQPGGVTYEVYLVG